MTEPELELQVRNAANAARILNDPLVQSAINGMRETVYHNIRTSSFKQQEEREDLYKMLKAIDSFEVQFKEAINGGKKAESRLKELFNKLR